VPVIYKGSSEARNSTALPMVILATLPWRLMMSPDIRCSGNRGNGKPLYHFCVHTRRICSSRSMRQQNCLELGFCGAGRSTKKLLTRAIAPITLATLSIPSQFLSSLSETRSPFMNRMGALHLTAAPTVMGLAVLTRFLVRPQLLTRVSSSLIS
jgi:hypothetical protein